MNAFAQSQDEALALAKAHKWVDPLSNVPAALLNSADIYEYVQKTGMIFPFTPTETKLKSASYEVDFIGEVYYCDENGEDQHRVIEKDSEFTLLKNSIAFVFLSTVFRLPDYIALRFNLKITHVHRGLLLGTGPLVDPGYEGRLLIPLHNLTSEPYKLIGGKGLIWVEFTKLSPNSRWNATSDRPSDHYHPFPEDKKYQKPREFFLKASHGRPSESSIPGEIRDAKADSANALATAQTAQTIARETDKSVKEVTRKYEIGILVTFAISIFAVVASVGYSTYQIAQLVTDTNQYIREARLEAINISQNTKAEKQELEQLKSKVIQLENKLKHTAGSPR